MNDLIDENQKQTDRIFNPEKNLGTAQGKNRLKNSEIQVFLLRLWIQPAQRANNNASNHQPNVPEGWLYKYVHDSIPYITNFSTSSNSGTSTNSSNNIKYPFPNMI